MSDIEKEINEETEETAEEAEEEAAEETGEPSSEETEEGPAEQGAAEESEAQESGETQKKKERKLNWTKKAQAQDEEAVQADEIATKIAEVNEKYTRLFAEFDNFRKRSEKEKSQMFDMGARNVIEKILPVLDSFERGLAQIPGEQKEDPFSAGMDKVYRQLKKTLEDLGVEPIEAVGKEFDPNFHNAVMHIDDENAGENIVVEEFQRGYTYKGSVVRFSMVKVAN